MSTNSMGLNRFRTIHPPQRLIIGAKEWTWFDSGGDQPGLMLLEGGLGNGDSCFPFFEPLAAHARIVAPRLPPELSRIAPGVEGLVGMLDSLRIARVHLFGHSQGGYLAQCLLRAQPDRVASLTLSATCPPSARHATLIERQFGLLRLLPAPVLRIAVAARIRRIAAPDLAPLPPGERRFWQDYLTTGLRLPDLRSRLVAAAQLQRDYHRNIVFKIADLAAWPGRTLIITFGRDTLIEAQDAANLMAAYPTAEHINFPDLGHLGLIPRAPDIARFMAKMIDETL